MAQPVSRSRSEANTLRTVINNNRWLCKDAICENRETSLLSAMKPAQQHREKLTACASEKLQLRPIQFLN